MPATTTTSNHAAIVTIILSRGSTAERMTALSMALTPSARMANRMYRLPRLVSDRCNQNTKAKFLLWFVRPPARRLSARRLRQAAVECRAESDRLAIDVALPRILPGDQRMSRLFQV